ncbi:MAG: DsbA family protein [Hormoscilla sp.]
MMPSYTLSNLSTAARKALQLTALLLFCLAMTLWSLPAQAANRISPELESQILQVIRAHPEVIIESVEAYQQEQKLQRQLAQQAFLQKIKTNPQVLIGESPTTGATDGQVLFVEFSDFQCPYCGRAYQTVEEFMAKHADEVTLVYKHFPLISIHPEALPAAKAAWAATQQGKFWDYYGALFTQQDKLGDDFYLEIAQSLDLDIEQFNRDRNSAKAENAIQQDMQLGENLGVSGTPFFVMNDKAFSGAIPLEDMEKIFAQVR